MPDVASASDNELLALISRKENRELARAAWAGFYSRYVESLHGVCSFRIGWSGRLAQRGEHKSLALWKHPDERPIGLRDVVIEA